MPAGDCQPKAPLGEEVAFREPIVCYSTVTMVMVSYRQVKPKPIACITYQSAAVGCMGSCDVGSGWYISLGVAITGHICIIPSITPQSSCSKHRKTTHAHLKRSNLRFLVFEGAVTDMNLGRGPSGRGRKGHVNVRLGSGFPFNVQ
jgi:hypothetical protein